MRKLLNRIHDWWNPPCSKHPGHRLHEVDTEVLTGCAMMPEMCSVCWEEFQEEQQRIDDALRNQGAWLGRVPGRTAADR